MTVYVDQLITWPGKGQWCHMMADELSELHTMAANIGLRRTWFQNEPRHPHYDLTPRKRQQAITAGAVSVDSKTLLEKCSR